MRSGRSGVPSSNEVGRGRLAWLAVALLLSLPAWWLGAGRGSGAAVGGWVGLVAAAMPRAQALSAGLLAWDGAQWLSQPWRLWSAAWVHLSGLHLLANLLGIVLVAGLGWVAAPGPRAAWAWAASWPLTHLGLALRPELMSYGGLSGVLHAGVAVVVVATLADPRDRASRLIATLLGLGLLAKVMLERPWARLLSHPEGWDIAVVPWAHASGAVCGMACALLLLVLPTRWAGRPGAG